MITVVTTQEELDAAIERGAEGIVIDSPPGVWLEILREVTMYQAVCDKCGGTADDLGAEDSSWLDADDGTAQRDPLARIARALELYAVTGTFKATSPSDVRERAWRAMQALVREIEGDAAGPQDVVRQRAGEA